MDESRASLKSDKPIVYIDMDGVLVDFDKRKNALKRAGAIFDKLFDHPELYKNMDQWKGQYIHGMC